MFFPLCPQTVGIVPPSITYSLPVMAEALSDARKATSSATSSGLFGRPKGMPPSISIGLCQAVANRLCLYRPFFESFSWGICFNVSMKPGETVLTRNAPARRGPPREVDALGVLAPAALVIRDVDR